MLIVAIDTSWKHGGIALAKGDQNTCTLLDSAPLQGGTFSAQLVPQIAAILARNGFTKHDLHALAAVVGPGSFTGLRVGLAAVKGLAEVLRLPIATATVLELLALAAAVEGRVIAALDASRHELFFGDFGVQGGFAVPREQTLLAEEPFIARLRGAGPLPAGRLVTADASVAALLQGAALESTLLARPSAAEVARLGLRKVTAGQTVAPEALDAAYLRRSDAEIFSKK
jgi:tRNA threonylcarbamoyladenosine biosynthesis protein TsaB